MEHKILASLLRLVNVCW